MGDQCATLGLHINWDTEGQRFLGTIPFRQDEKNDDLRDLLKKMPN
jgi:hypothetical protein